MIVGETGDAGIQIMESDEIHPHFQDWTLRNWGNMPHLHLWPETDDSCCGIAQLGEPGKSFRITIPGASGATVRKLARGLEKEFRLAVKRGEVPQLPKKKSIMD